MNASGSFKTGCGIFIAIFIAFIAMMFAINSVDFSTGFLLIFLLMLAAVIAVIFWIIGTAKAVKDLYVYTRDAIISLFTIEREIKQKCPDALRAAILEKKQHSVKVGIWDASDTLTANLTISGSGDVANDVYEGQEILL